MSKFHCKIMDENNNITEDYLISDSKSELISTIRSKGWKPISIKLVDKNEFSLQLFTNKNRKLKKKAVILFCRQMATLLNAGIEIIECCSIISTLSEDKIFKEALEKLYIEIQSGSILSESMKKQGEMFPDMLINMISVGEATGDISGVMERMANHYEKADKIRNKIKSAMAYPISVVVISILASIFMLTKIIPGFADIFNSMGVELPLLTRIMMKASDYFINRWYVLLIIFSLIVYLIKILLRNEKITKLIDKKLVTMRFIKNSILKIECSKMARTLYTLIASGISIIESLKHVMDNEKNLFLKEKLNEIILEVQKGKKFSLQMSQYELFPRLFVSMIAIGEESGNLEEMLFKLADYYEEETEATINQLISVFEPAMMLFVAVNVGIMVIAVYMPMFNVVTAIGGY